MSLTLFAVAGNWLGNLGTARAAIHTLKHQGIHLLFHLGDLAGRWPGPKKGRFDTRLEQILADADIEFLFIDGDHDNHPELRRLPLQPDGTRQLSPGASAARTASTGATGSEAKTSGPISKNPPRKKPNS